MPKTRIESTGSCLCGTVKYKVSGEALAFYLCHCTRCRKATGSAHASNVFTQPDNIEWLSGADAISRYELHEAERFAKQFCAHCGSSLPFVNRTGEYLIIPAGTLDDGGELIPENNIFWGSRAPWYDAGLAAECCDQMPARK